MMSRENYYFLQSKAVVKLNFELFFDKYKICDFSAWFMSNLGNEKQSVSERKPRLLNILHEIRLAWKGRANQFLRCRLPGFYCFKLISLLSNKFCQVVLFVNGLIYETYVSTTN